MKSDKVRHVIRTGTKLYNLKTTGTSQISAILILIICLETRWQPKIKIYNRRT